MGDCLLNHKESSLPPSKAQLPTRVIDVGPPDGSELPKVITTQGNCGIWVSLSHCWGTRTRFVLDSTNAVERMHGITTADLPTTFRDAIQVTRKLGFRFLWIDSLYILQDWKEDWVLESCLMQRYYEEASLTIASDSSCGDEQSFLHRSKHQSAVAIPVKFHSALMPRLLKVRPKLGEVVYIRHSLESYDNLVGLDVAQLVGRAWTLQEEFFSPRTVHYSPDQLLWECWKGKMTEGLRTMLLPETYQRLLHLKNVSVLSMENIFLNDKWYILVESYVPRQLTFLSDKFPASSALARFVRKQTNFTYRAGIWLEDYDIGLIWFCKKIEKRPAPYVAPSWSWASIKTDSPFMGVLHPQRTTSDSAIQKVQDKRAVLDSCEVALKGADDCGQLLSGTITLLGTCVSSQALTSSPMGQMTFRHGTLRGPLQGIPNNKTVLCLFDENFPVHRPLTHFIGYSSPISESALRDICFFYVTTASYPEGSWSSEDKGNISYFLLLEPTKEGQFSRIGIAMMLMDTFLAVKVSRKVKEVIII